MRRHTIGLLVPASLCPQQVSGAARAVLGLNASCSRRRVGDMMMYVWSAPPGLPQLAVKAAVLANRLPQPRAEGWLGQTVAGEYWEQGFLWPLVSPPHVAVGWMRSPVRWATQVRTELSLYALSPGRYTVPVPAGKDGTAVLRVRKRAEALEVRLDNEPMPADRQVSFTAGQQITVRMRVGVSGGAGLELEFSAPR